MEICITESRENALGTSSPSDSQLYYAKDCAHFDEFVLDLSTLPDEYDYENLLETATPEDRSSTLIPSDLDKTDFDRRNTATDESGDTCASTSSGYESDSEDEVLASVNKRRRVRKVKYRQEQHSGENNWSKSNKRKSCADDDLQLSSKRIKVSSSSDDENFKAPHEYSSSDSDYSSSSSDSSSDSDSSSFSWSSSDSVSSSDSSTSSDCSSSDSDTQFEDSSIFSYKYLNPFKKVIPCPDSCVCNAGQSRPPAPIQRDNRTPVNTF